MQACHRWMPMVLLLFVILVVVVILVTPGMIRGENIATAQLDMPHVGDSTSGTATPTMTTMRDTHVAATLISSTRRQQHQGQQMKKNNEAFVTVSGASVDEQCANAIKAGEPTCYHGGTFVARNTTEAINCASCNCPHGWAGVDCSLCTHVDSCPSIVDIDSGNDAGGGEGTLREKKPTGCSSNSVAPFAEEMRKGKQLRCECGGDPMTDSYCSYQPATNWHFNVTRDALEIKEFAGTASINLAPPNDPLHYKYLFPGVFTGTWGKCSWYQSNCTDHPTGPCVILECDAASNVSCPPPGIEKCPGFSTTGCATDPSGKRPYLQHHCLAVPSKKAVQLACPLQKNETTNSFHCYFKQEGGLITNLGMMCKTGGCLYDSITPPEPLPPSPHAALSTTPAIVLTCIGSIYAAFVVAVVLLAYSELRRKDDHHEKQQRSDDDDDTYERCPVAPGGERFVSSDSDVHAPGASHIQTSVTFTDIGYTLAPRTHKGCGRLRILLGIDGFAGHEDGHTRAMGGEGSGMHTSQSTTPRHHDGNSNAGIFAILGPSGAGKTTLLEILSGHPMPGRVQGRMHVNGTPVPFESMRTMAGFVPQDVVLPGTSTVWEYLAFHASLRLPSNVRAHERRARVSAIIRELGLGKVQDSLIGDDFIRGLSGGEKRRVSIASELITQPAILMLDEPTTGLDSTNAAKVVDILSGLVSAGVTVLISIHQPRSDVFQMLRRVLILSGEGTMVYSGPTRLATEHFSGTGLNTASRPSHLHIADFVLDAVIRSSHDEVDALVRSYASSSVAARERQVAASVACAPTPALNGANDTDTFVYNNSGLPFRKHKADFVCQLRLLCGRLLRKSLRHPMHIILTIVVTMLMSLIAGALFFRTGIDTPGIQDRFGFLFFVVLYLSMSSLSSIPIWTDERLLFMHESSLGVYSTRAYFLAVVLMDIIPLRVVPPSFFAFFSYWMIGLHPDCGVCIIWYTLVLVITNVCATMMCVAIGALTKRSMSGNLVGSSLIMFFVLFGGFLLNKDKIPIFCKWMEYTSFLHYAFELLAINEFDKSPLTFVFTSALPANILPDLPVQGEEILRQFGFDADLFYVDMTQLILLTAVFTAIAFVGLGSIHGRIAFKIANYSKAMRTAASRLTALGSVLGDDDAEFIRTMTTSELSINGSGATETEPFLDAGKADSNTLEHTTSETSGIAVAMDEVIGNALVAWDISYVLPSIGRNVLSNISSLAGGDDDDDPNRSRSESDNGNESTSSAGIFAILGPSGAGKTTLLEILSGHPMPGRVQGRMHVNGTPVPFESMRTMAGFVPQDVVLPGTSTVWEYLAFHASLRLPSNVRAHERRARVSAIIRELGLGKVQDSLIGDDFIRGLSGGEKRRVSIASELITQPAILMLDEPTTGLDSTNAAKVVDILSGLVSAGVTVLISIHQPRSDVFQMLRRVLILSGEGTMVYSGPTRLATEHFSGTGLNTASRPSHLHIADFVLDAVIRSSHDEVDALVRSYASSSVAARERQVAADAVRRAPAVTTTRLTRQSLPSSSLPRTKYTAPFHRQVGFLVRRHLQKILRHPFVTISSLMGYLFMAVFIGVVFYDTDVDSGGIQDRMGSHFFIIMYMALTCLTVIPIWMEDYQVLFRENHSLVYSVEAYFLSVVMIDTLLMRLVPTTFFALPYAMIGLGGGAVVRGVTFVLLLMLLNASFSGLCMAIGAATTSAAVANFVGSFIVQLFLLSCGFLVNGTSIPMDVRWIVDVLVGKNGYEALLINEFSGADRQYYFTSHADPNLRIPVSGDKVLSTFGYSPRAFTTNIAIVAISCLMFYSIAFVLLKARTSRA